VKFVFSFVLKNKKKQIKISFDVIANNVNFGFNDKNYFNMLGSILV
jgi:hypothetical protein